MLLFRYIPKHFLEKNNNKILRLPFYLDLPALQPETEISNGRSSNQDNQEASVPGTMGLQSEVEVQPAQDTKDNTEDNQLVGDNNNEQYQPQVEFISAPNSPSYEPSFPADEEVEIDWRIKSPPRSPKRRLDEDLGWTTYKYTKHQHPAQSFGNSSLFNFCPLGSTLLPLESLSFFLSMPVFGIDFINKVVHLSKSMWRVLDSKLSLKQVDSYTFVGLDPVIFPNPRKYSSPTQTLNMMECNIVQHKGRAFYNLICSAPDEQLGGLFLVKSIRGAPEDFGLASPNNGDIIASGKFFCSCYQDKYETHKSEVTAHIANRKHRVLDTYGIIFSASFTVKEGTSNELLNSCVATNSHINVYSRGYNPVQLSSLFMLVCGTKHIVPLLHKLDNEERVQLFTKFQTLQQITDLLSRYNLSTEEKNDIVIHNVINIEDIAAHSIFQCGLVIVPMKRAKALSFLMTPSLITELVLRHHLREKQVLIA